jgi:DNA-binding response OmpR family regulator
MTQNRRREVADGLPLVRDRNGELITPNMLPSMNARWTPRRREIAILALRTGLITIEQALARWCMTEDELREWRAAPEKATAETTANSLVIPKAFPRWIQIGGVALPVGRSEYLILQITALHKGKVVTPRMIGNILYGARTSVKNRVIDVMISRLRVKLRTSGVVIETVWGRGYLLRDRKPTQSAAQRLENARA